MPARLIINADDFGLSPSVNQAIIGVYKAGNLSSTTLMVDMPGTENAVELAQANPGLAIGLHFCLTEGSPLTRARSLINEQGTFFNRPQLAKRLLKKQVDLSEIRAEFQAQLDRAQSFGLDIAHSDSHQHVMMLTPVFKAILPILRELGLPVRIVRPPSVRFGQLFLRPKKFAKQNLNILLADRIKGMYPGMTNQYLVSVHDLDDPMSMTKNTFHELLAETPADSTTELMVHPYLMSEELLTIYGNTYAGKISFMNKCVREYELLSDKPLFEDYDLINFSQL